MTLSLSPAEARKLVLVSQRVLMAKRHGKAIDATLDIIEHLGYIQIDTISVIAMAHHHTLWNRNPRYQQQQLDRLVSDRKVYEYWSHAAAYLPMRDYRFSLPRMENEAANLGRWHEKDPKLMTTVLKRIESEGPLMARDFEDPNPGKKAMWEWKPAKYALEQLFMEGRIMTTRREGFNKVYDLRERVLPDTIDCRMPSEEEYAQFLIHSFLRSHGLGQLPEFCHLRKGMRTRVQQTVKDMVESGELEQVTVGKSKQKSTWFMLPNATELLTTTLARSKVKLLSPFDNFVILRKRILQLFNFDYQIECYVPAEKRQYGYFSLPMVWQGKLVARVDCKAHRDKRIFELRNLKFEQGVNKREEVIEPMARELMSFAVFNNCEKVVIGDVSDKLFGKQLSQMVKA